MAVDVHRPRDGDPAQADRLGRREAILAVEDQTEPAHQLAVEARCREGLYEYLDAAEAVNRRAERCAPRAYLGRAHATGVDPWWIDILNAPVGAVGVDDVVEGEDGIGKPDTLYEQCGHE